MRYERVYLKEGRTDVFLDVYVADKVFDFVRDAILVIPGGGYHTVCSEHEGEPIAQAFMPYGFNAFVLHYSVDGAGYFPDQLIEASLAMKYIRDHAKEFCTDPDRVFVTGFSAGGHLCTMLGTLWHLDAVRQAIDMPFGYNKPTGIIPVYPVITADMRLAHRGSFYNLCGADVTEEQMEAVSLEKCVDERSAPACIIHTSDDQVVDSRNSLWLAEAYAAKGLPYELHVFRHAPHGMALSNPITNTANPHNAHWVELAVEWTREIKKAEE